MQLFTSTLRLWDSATNDTDTPYETFPKWTPGPFVFSVIMFVMVIFTLMPAFCSCAYHRHMRRERKRVIKKLFFQYFQFLFFSQEDDLEDPLFILVKDTQNSQFPRSLLVSTLRSLYTSTNAVADRQFNGSLSLDGHHTELHGCR